jgi:hypothetical protein
MPLRFAVPVVMSARDGSIQTAVPRVRAVTMVVSLNGQLFEGVENASR